MQSCAQHVLKIIFRKIRENTSKTLFLLKKFVKTRELCFESILQKVIVEKICQIEASQSIVEFRQNRSSKDNLDSTSMMESSENKNCGHCNNPGAVKKCCKSHTRCKEVRFCNKLCEKDAHTKKPTEKQPEDPNAIAEKLLKKEVEAKMKKNAKVKRKKKSTYGQQQF